MPSVCVIGHPAPGHVNPTLPVVAELSARGERVTYFASEPFRPAIERTGARFRACGAHELFERNLGSGGMLGGMAGLIRTAEEILPGLIDSVREEAPDYLLVEAHAVWGNLLAQVLRLPAATLCSMFAMNERLLSAADLMHHLYGGAPREAAIEGLAALGEYFEFARQLGRRYGVECPGIIQYLGNPQRLNIVFTSREFQPGGSLFDIAYVFVGPQPEGRAEPEFPFEQLGDEPLILISMGTMYNDEPAFYRACFDAFGKSRYRIVLAAGHRINAAALTGAPGNFLVRQYVPQVALLKRASLFITHGGINSAHEAMLHGVPMVVLPQRADHYVVAGQVEKAGAGLVLDRSAVSAARLVELSEAVLREPGYRRNSASMGETLRRAGGAARAADAIQSFIRAVTPGERTTLCQ
jgi:MGT family glycosyltransferase